MRFHSIELINFKSIGEEYAEIIIEPDITTIIGKNESGKSNVLEALSYISFTEDMSKAFDEENINRNNVSVANIQYNIVLKPTCEEKINMFENDTRITITKDKFVIQGGAIDWYISNIETIREGIFSILNSNPLNYVDNNLVTYNKYIGIIKESVHPRYLGQAINFLKDRVKKIKTEDRENFLGLWSEFENTYEKYVSLYPTVFYRNSNRILKQKYTLDEVQKELENPFGYRNSLLFDFVKILEISNDEFQSAVATGMKSSQSSTRARINRRIISNINDKFNAFYTVEKVQLSAEFANNLLSFNIQSEDGETMHVSERSNGLRWYLNMFIDSLANNVQNKNTLYLFDEPGVYLHINAQVELLKLFDDLAEKNNQLVYTTHSPYMLKLREGGIHKIRAVDKNIQGYTSIYKTAYDSKIEPAHQMDTLSPIIKAIGMDLVRTFGPARDKLNVVCEGVSDYIYIKTLFEKLELEAELNFIPSIGATNVQHICNILLGWGCPFKAIFDYDMEGIEKGAKVMQKSELYAQEEDFIFIKYVEQSEIEDKTYKTDSYEIEDLIGRRNLETFAEKCGLGKDAVKRNKVLLSKFYTDALISGEEVILKNCEEGVKNLYSRLQ